MRRILQGNNNETIFLGGYTFHTLEKLYHQQCSAREDLMNSLPNCHNICILLDTIKTKNNDEVIKQYSRYLQ